VADYFAVGCQDYPQLFAMSSVPAQRSIELSAAEAALPAGAYSPFTTAEWLAQDQNTAAYTGCSRWPAPAVAQSPLAASGSSLPLLPNSVPVLALGGELDSWTPPADVPKLLAELGGHARFIELANTTHVVGEGETICGSVLIRVFIARPAGLDTLDGSCAPVVSAIHSVGSYPTVLAAVAPLEPSPGDAASATALRLAAAAVQTAGDAIARYQATEASRDRGLHGGTVTAAKDGELLTLGRDQLVPGVAVSGTVTLAPAPLAEDGQTAVATLTATAAGGPPATFTATWTTSGSGAIARVAGVVAGASISGTLPAP
jgi:TAP-like protein